MRRTLITILALAVAGLPGLLMAGLPAGGQERCCCEAPDCGPEAPLAGHGDCGCELKTPLPAPPEPTRAPGQPDGATHAPAGTHSAPAPVAAAVREPDGVGPARAAALFLLFRVLLT